MQIRHSNLFANNVYNFPNFTFAVKNMCILFLHTNPEPQDDEYRLVVAMNRDLYYERPAKPAFRCPQTGIIAGRDMEPGREGGTWLGFRTKTNPQNSKDFKHCLCCLTNLAGAKIENCPGRGRLVTDYLERDTNYSDYVNDLHQRGRHCSGFNLITVELSKENVTTYHHSNRPRVDSVYTGKHTLSFSNSTISSPFMKVVYGKEKFLEIIGRKLKKEQLRDQLISLLKDKTKFVPDHELERRYRKGVDKFSSIYVDFPEFGYGTRSHTVILINKDWDVEFMEMTMESPIDKNQPKWKTTVIQSVQKKQDSEHIGDSQIS